MVNPPLLDALREALARQPDVRVVTLFGSHARGHADAESDIDLQIITARPQRFVASEWLPPLSYPLLAYGLRPAFGGVVKATAIYPQAEADVVVLPLARLRLARLLVGAGLHRRSPKFQRACGDLAIVLRPGFSVLQGGAGWQRFFERVVAEVPDPRLDDEAVMRLADCAFADYVSLRRKLKRGELLAAQRWLHVHLAETNFKLLHEANCRRGLRSSHDARRLEQELDPARRARVRVEASASEEALRQAARQSIQTTRELVEELTRRPPTWADAVKAM
ncbi:MAG TPA: nucleotidyltransferase domain-containing protein [Candidatus Synoicihabitans sp.]|nr:nucleotidyltransferase domain-containing protein [Candidatus Synoicihabitans sp.]